MSLKTFSFLQATTRRLAKLKADGETQLSERFSTMMDLDPDVHISNQIKLFERESLESYSDHALMIYEKILRLAKEKLETEGIQTDDVVALKTAIEYTCSVLSLVSSFFCSIR